MLCSRSIRAVLRPCRLVVFDKDGTLLDDAKTWAPVIEQLGARLASRVEPAQLYELLGYEPRTQHFGSRSVFMTATNNEIAEILAAKFDAEMATEFRRFFRELPPSAGCGAALTPLRPLFEDLRAAGVLVGMLTSDDRVFAEAFLKHHDVLDLVSASVCGDDGLAPKPSAEPLMKICERLGVDPQEAAMVGDSADRDIGAGLAANFGSVIGVTSGISPADELASAGAHAVVSNASEVLGVVRRRHAALTATWASP
mmetsp:Transcript_137477/g.439262  ORF Transcript_137477/g.439262 Transcript_137477/m.439262 type:complete len:255 (+) Transcript_137477:87-851(+)